MKKNDSKNEFISLLGRFFTEYLPVSVNASPNTIASYKCAFRLLFQYLNEETDIKIGHTYSNGKGRLRKVVDIGPQYKLYDGQGCDENMRYEIVRDGSASFADYSESRNLEAGYIFKNSLKKIYKKTFRKVKGKQRCSFTRRELEILFSLPDTTEKLGWRDLVLLCVMYSSGARAQEICDLTVKLWNSERQCDSYTCW